MSGPAIDPEGNFLQPGDCPIDPYTGEPVCPPTREKDCLLVEKVYDQCFKEDIITRSFEIPTGSGEPCEGVDLSLVDRVDCTVLSADCEVVDVSNPIDTNIRIVTVRQDITIRIDLVDETPGGDIILCSFTETIDDFFNDAQLFVPPSGAMFGAAGGPFVFCDVVGSTCFCRLETTGPGELPTRVICTVKVCKIIEVTALVKLLVPVYGFCVPRPCEAAPQQKEIQCPPIEDLFPPQPETPDP